MRWKLLILTALAAYALACAPKRTITQFAKNKEAEAGQTYTEEQLRAALGSDRYDSLIVGIGQDNLNLLTYGIGISNMTNLLNQIQLPGKLPALMSDGPNSRKLNAIEVLDLLNKTDDALSNANFVSSTSTSDDTVKKIGKMINGVTVAGMEGIKNIVHGVIDNSSDRNLTPMPNAVSRLGQLIGGLSEASDVMTTLIADLAAPSGVFSASGNAKLIRLVNGTEDMVDLIKIISETNNLSNITGVMVGLTGNIYCSRPEYLTKATCEGAPVAPAPTWYNTMCSVGSPSSPHVTRAACTAAGGVWTPDGIQNMTRMINELDRVCSNTSHTNAMACFNAGANWRTKASKIPVIVNNITNVPNMYTIVNGLTNDGKRPAWPTVALPVGLGLPTAYPGDGGNVFDGVDSMVATINKLYVGSDADSFGLNGTLRLAYMVNNLDVTPVFGNDTNFDDTTGGFSCTTGNFNNRLNWGFSNNGSASAPFNGMGWATDGLSTQAGACALRNDPTAATIFTQTLSAELVANITTAGNMTFYYRTQLNAGDTLRFFVDDVQVVSYTGTIAWAQRTQAVTTGVHRFRWDVQRRLNSTGQAYIDTVALPGDKGAARTAAEKTFIMLNNLYIASSITNVADILSNVTAPACIATPLTCTPDWNNGLDTLIHTVNRVEYPALLSSVPRLATTVNTISNLQIMYDIMNNMNSQASTNQLVAMMDFVQTPATLPTLINELSGQAGVRTADILKSLTSGGTSNMLRVLADAPNGAPVLDTARLLNGVPNTIRVAEILNKLKLTANVYNTTTAGVSISVASPAVVTWTGHGLVQNARVSFSTTGRLPTGLFSGRVYYACIVDANSFRLSTDLSCSALQNSTAAGSGTHTALAGDETFFQSPNPGGGQKLAQFFNAVNSKGSGSANTCNVNDNEDDFCIKNHLVRLVNDIANSAAGSTTVAEIVSNLRPNAGPGGNDGVTRMVDVLFEMKNQTFGNNYTDPLSNSTAEDFGRLTTFIKDMTGGNAGLNTARMVNEVQLAYMSSRVTFLLKNINRMRYLSRMLSEMTSVDLMLQLLNDSSTVIGTIDTLVDTHGNGTYGAGAIGSYAGAFYGASPTGYGCTTVDCDTNTTDQLGRLIQMINNIYAIGNTLTLVNTVTDIGYVSYLVNSANRIKYLTDIVNNLTNIDLLVKILNGADACSVYVAGVNDVTDTSATCTTAGGTWSGVGKCKSTPAQTTLAGCPVNQWEGAERAKMLALVNNIGDSEYLGNVNAGNLLGAGVNSKAVGNMYVLWDTVNKLGYNGATARSLGQQMRVVKVINQIQYCGLKPQYDKRIQNGPTCVNGSNVIQTGYQHEEACTAAGLFWKAKYNSTNSGNCTTAGGQWLTDGCWMTASSIFNTCSDATYDKPTAGPQTPGVYFANGDRFDGRNRTAALMLGVTDGTAFSTVVGDVQETQKTINMVNGVRRVRTLSQFVKWTPGAVTAALVNNTHPTAVLRSLVYLANNLEDDEDTTAKAFASMVHFGVRIVAQGKETAAPTCLEFTGLGPRRLAAVMNLEAGPYLEGLVSNLGWNMSTAAMNCGWGRDDGENAGSCSAEDGGTGGMYKQVGSSYVGNPKPTALQCIRPRELTAGYRYGNWTWSAGTQGITAANCQSLMPERSGLSICDSVTDSMIWGGFSSVDDGIGQGGCSGTTCDDMWSVLKGTGGGIVGSLMASNSSYVGFPPPRVYSNAENDTAGIRGGGTICTDASGNNGNNWQCVRVGLQSGDLRPGDTGNGYYWGTYCAAGTSQNVPGITGAISTQTLARNCIFNDGSWKTEKNYQGPSCNVDPSLGVKVGP